MATLPTAEQVAGATRRTISLGRHGDRLRRFLVALVVPALVLVLWSLGVRFGWTLPLDIRMAQLPTPADVGNRLLDLFVGGRIDDPYSGQVWRHAWASIVRASSGFAIAAALAIPCGVLIGRSRMLTELFEPLVNLVRPIPVTAWAPLSLLLIGIGDRSAIFLVFLAAFFPMLISTTAAATQVPPRLLEAAAMLGMSRGRRLVSVVTPASLPGIVNGLRVGLGLAWALLVVGEMTGVRIGLGAMIMEGRVVSKIDLIMAGMILIGLLGYLSDRLLLLAVRVLSRGRPVLQEVR